MPKVVNAAFNATTDALDIRGQGHKNLPGGASRPKAAWRPRPGFEDYITVHL